MFDVTQIYKIGLEILVAPSSRNLASKNIKFWDDFAQRRDLIANISRTQQDIVDRKMALQTTDTPAQANLIHYTLVHEQRKIGPEFWPTQWAAIRLGISTHLVAYCRSQVSEWCVVWLVGRNVSCYLRSTRSWPVDCGLGSLRQPLKCCIATFHHRLHRWRSDVVFCYDIKLRRIWSLTDLKQ